MPESRLCDVPMMYDYSNWLIGAAMLVLVAVFVSPWAWCKLVQRISAVLDWCKQRKWAVRIGCSWKHARTVYIGYHAYPWVKMYGGIVKLRSVGLVFWTISIVSQKPLKEPEEGDTVNR